MDAVRSGIPNDENRSTGGVHKIISDAIVAAYPSAVNADASRCKQRVHFMSLSLNCVARVKGFSALHSSKGENGALLDRNF